MGYSNQVKETIGPERFENFGQISRTFQIEQFELDEAQPCDGFFEKAMNITSQPPFVLISETTRFSDLVSSWDENKKI